MFSLTQLRCSTEWAKKERTRLDRQNSNLISGRLKVFLHRFEIISDLELQPDHPLEIFGTCNRCTWSLSDRCYRKNLMLWMEVNAFPYFTIELKENPISYWVNLTRLFGCDTVMFVRGIAFLFHTKWKTKKPIRNCLHLITKAGEKMTEEVFKKFSAGLHGEVRTGYKGLIRNLEFIRRKPSWTLQRSHRCKRRTLQHTISSITGVHLS